MENAATHERGHTYGLLDISGSTHTELTMYYSAPSNCETKKQTLALGDWTGMVEHYPS